MSRGTISSIMACPLPAIDIQAIWAEEMKKRWRSPSAAVVLMNDAGSHRIPSHRLDFFISLLSSSQPGPWTRNLGLSPDRLPANGAKETGLLRWQREKRKTTMEDEAETR